MFNGDEYCKPPKEDKEDFSSVTPEEPILDEKSKFPKNFEIIPGQSTLQNPGNIDNLHKKTKDIMPVWMDGVQLGYIKKLKINKTMLCNWTLSNNTPSGFRIGGIYHASIKGNNIVGTPTIEADINPTSLAANLSFLYHPVRTLRFELLLQTGPCPYSPKSGNQIMSIEKIGKSSMVTFNVYNPTKDSGRFTLSYLQSVTTNLSLGTELLYEWYEGESTAKTALAARYSINNSSLASTCSQEALDISYWHQIHKAIQIGSSLVYNKKKGRAIGSIFYQWEFQDAFVRSMLDSDWSVGFTYNRRLKDMACFLGFSFLFCVPTNKFACGFKFDVESSGNL